MTKVINNNGILQIPSEPNFEPAPGGYGLYCFNKMKQFSDRTAQIDSEINKSDTYAEILVRSIRVAMKIKSLGINENDIVSLCTNTHRYTCLPYWAAVFSGVKIANLDPSLSLGDIKHLTNIVKPKLIFCNPECVENFEIVIKELKLDAILAVFGDTKEHMPFKTFLEPQNGEKDFTPKIAENLFNCPVILFSSGTTGLPKGICLTHYGILYSAHAIRNFSNMETLLYYTSPYWISCVILLTSSLIEGGKRILCMQFDETNVLKIVQNYKVTYLFMPPTFTYAVTSHFNTNKESYDTSSLHTMMVAGSKLEAEQVNKVKTVFPHCYINQLYGLTEIAGTFSVFDATTQQELINSKPSSCGTMLPGTTCKVINIETQKIVGPNEPGELLIKSKRIMNGYYKDPQRTAEVFDEDGFLHTGDLVYYDEDYCFYIVNRIKEMFKYKSWHIVPAELENILRNHPAVKEVLVIGLPHEVDGDHPMAVIILNDDVIISEADIIQYFNDQVIDRKKLRGVKFVKSFPKTSTGKYSRLMLRSMVINNII